MAPITVSVSEIIAANHLTIYNVIADYHIGHQAILPRPAFHDMQVLDGGFGAGTRTRIHMKLFGLSFYYNHIVEEPEKGYVLVERDVDTGQTSTFTLEPLSDNETKVTITVVKPLDNGIHGLLQRITEPPIMKNLFKNELKNLADYLA